MLDTNQHLLRSTGAIRLDGQRFICRLCLPLPLICMLSLISIVGASFAVTVCDMWVAEQHAVVGAIRCWLSCNELRLLPCVAVFSVDSILAIQDA